MNRSQKKAIKMAQIKELGYKTTTQRKYLWEYILKGDLGVGYYNAQVLAKNGFNVLKPLAYYEDQPK